MTQAVDGMLAGEVIHYRIWKKSIAKEYIVDHVSYSSGAGLSTDGLYQPNALFAIGSIAASASPAPPLGGYLLVPLQWGRVPVAYQVLEYQVQVDTLSSFGSPLYSASISADTSVTPALLFPFLKVHYWRIRARNVSGWSNWSEIWHFTTMAVPVPPAPILIAPTNGETNVKLNF
jgi:hypothetical protein